MNSNQTPFSKYVKSKRIGMSITQLQLAELSGLSLEFIRDIEQGRINLRLEKVILLVEALGGAISVNDKPFDPSTLNVEND